MIDIAIFLHIIWAYCHINTDYCEVYIDLYKNEVIKW